MIRQNRKYKNLTFTFEEWQRIEKLSAECGMKTATYIKHIALNGKVVNLDLHGCHEFVSALNKIGSNVNQIARVANASGYATADELRQLERFREEVCRISSAYLSEIQLKAA